LFFSLFSLVFWSSFALLSGVNFQFFGASLIYGLISAVLAQGSYIYALSKGELSITGTILATFPVYTIIFSFLINGEHLNSVQAVFVGVTILGTILVSLPEKLNREDLRKSSKYILFPIASAILIGLSDTLTKRLINQTNSATFLLGGAIMQIPTAFIFMKLAKEKLSQFSSISKIWNDYRPALLAAFLISLHTMTIFIAFQFAPASIASPIIGGAAPVLTLILSVLILKEKVLLKDKIAIAITLVGIIGISLLAT